MDRAIVTTLIPTYRRPSTLARAITSALDQTERAIRVVVYDNASGDDTPEVVRRLQMRDPRLVYHRHESHIDAQRNFQFALEHVRTPFFSFLSDDDFLLPGFYEAALSILLAHADLAFVSGAVINVDECSRQLLVRHRLEALRYTPPDGLVAMVAKGHPNWMGTLFDSRVLAIVGSIDPATGIVMDMDFMLRIAARCNFRVVDLPFAVYVHHEGGASGGANVANALSAWQRMISNLLAEARLPMAVRQTVVRSLQDQLQRHLRRVGMGAARRGNYAAARLAAGMSRRIGDRAGAMAITFATFVLSNRPLQTLLDIWIHMRRPYVRDSWTGRIRLLAEHPAVTGSPSVIRLVGLGKIAPASVEGREKGFV